MSDRLDDAYSLAGPDACKTLYAGWARDYDHDFARARGYRLPDAVAHALAALPLPDGPILDLGAGTGLVAEALRAAGISRAIDAVDLSAAMLEEAQAKALYRHLIEADVTAAWTAPDTYAALVSAGTFTHGHVGPEGLETSLRHLASGAAVVISINEGVFVSKGFDAFLQNHPQVRGLELVRVPIYAGRAPDGAVDSGGAHADDTALIARFHLP